jgi:hypothetical protein
LIVNVISPSFVRSCVRHAIPPSKFALVVRVTRQTVLLFRQASISAHRGSPAGGFGTPREFQFLRSFRCSTSRFGIGQVAGSNRTPLGLHRIAEKIGGGWPAGTVFQARQPVGFTWKGMPDAMITTRILWLEGLEPGFNRGGDVDSHARYIYIHGTGDETTLGCPASCGCIHLATADLIPLYDRLPAGTLVWIGR